MRAGHVPAAPTLLDRRVVIGRGRSQARKKQRVAIAIGKDRLREQAAGSAQPVAARALRIPTQEPRLSRCRGLERIKDDALRRVERGQLDVAALRESDKDVVVEIDGARRFGTNKVSVKAGFGENQQLRVDVHIEVLEQTGQEPLSILLVLEFHLAPLDLLLEKGDGIRAG